MSTVVNADALKANTPARYVEIHETLGSTNDRAAELAAMEDIELPALVVARRQTAGRGRGGHTWWAAEGALTFSFVLDAASIGVAPPRWPLLSLTSAVAVCDALEMTIGNDHTKAGEARLRIKWPNDVLVEGRKVCGILIESSGGADSARQRVILGIGINVNNSWRDAPVEAGLHGTALCDLTQADFDLEHVLIRVLNSIEQRIQELRYHNSALFEAWRRLDCLAGRAVVLQTDHNRFEGTVIEIAGDGALVLDTPVGSQRFYSGSVQLV